MGQRAAVFATGILSAVLRGVDKLDPAKFLVEMAVTVLVLKKRKIVDSLAIHPMIEAEFRS